MNPVGFDTISLLILLAFRFLGNAGATGGVGGAGCFGAAGTLLSISSYLGPAMGSGSGLGARGQKSREGDGVDGMEGISERRS